jgi:hypothetical protein
VRKPAEVFLVFAETRMAFRLVHARYDRETERAYVELRDADDDGGEMLATAIFSFRTTARLSKLQIEQDLVRKARHIFRRAAQTLEGS